MSRVLVADDEKNLRSSLAATLRLEGYAVEAVEDGEQALAALERSAFDLVLLDLQMPRLNGLEALRRLRAAGHRVPVIFLTAHGTIETAVEAVRCGAFDFIEKPPHAERILLAARNALRQAELEQENLDLREESAPPYDMLGQSAPMLRLFEEIRRTAPTHARVLILGENGTGKELIARALHRHSPRAEGPFVRVNCAAIPADLFESELFGHERGAFTGATGRRRGKFVRAHGGTLFLDEIAEMPLPLQAKLLRAIESGEVEPVGSDREVRVDARVIAATNRDLARAVAASDFRQDLYYRLQVVTLVAPPLRDRREDLPELVERFVNQAVTENHLPRRKLTEDALSRLARHDFPGNVRELRNLIERMLILCTGPTIDASAVERHLSVVPPDAGEGTLRRSGTLRETLAAIERRLVLQSLERGGWKMAAVAEELGLERSHLYKKLKALGIERDGGDEEA